MNAVRKLQPGAEGEGHEKKRPEEAGHFKAKQRFLEVVAPMEDTHTKAMEALSPLKVKVDDMVDAQKVAPEILNTELGRSFQGFIDAAEPKPHADRLLFVDSDVTVHAFSSPGLPVGENEFPQNRDAFVALDTPDGLHLVLTHGGAERGSAGRNNFESPALSKTAAVAAGYYMQRLHPPHLTEVFDGINNQVNTMKQELDSKDSRVSLMGVTLRKNEELEGTYDVEVMKAGDMSCFVMDPGSGAIKRVTPMTVAEKLAQQRVPYKRRDAMYAKIKEGYKEKSGQEISSQTIGGTLTMAAGLDAETFDPQVETIHAAPGEIVILASSEFMRSFGGVEHFTDAAVARRIAVQLKRGKKLNDILAGFMTDIVSRQGEGKFSDGPVSVVGFEVPGNVGGGQKPKKMSVEEVLGAPELQEAGPEDVNYSEMSFEEIMAHASTKKLEQTPKPKDRE